MADEKNIEYASSVKVCVGGRLSWNLELNLKGSELSHVTRLL